MSRPLTRCIAALPPSGGPRVAALGRFSRATTTTTRLLATTRPQRQDDTPIQTPSRTQPAEKPLRDFFGGPLATNSPATRPWNPYDASQRLVMKALGKNIDTSPLSGDPGKAARPQAVVELEPHHLHIYSHKHNTHITLTQPDRKPLISLSCGNLGYRKSRRGTFDSAYSLTKYVLERITYTGIQLDRLELVLRGFGPGREAAVKVLLSPEGKLFRERIIRVADSTRVKFGGTRSEKPRRL